MKPFACKQCEYASAKKGNLNVHMKKPVRSSIYERIEINFDDNKREAVSANAMEGCSTHKSLNVKSVYT